jgi:hypothetical protein
MTNRVLQVLAVGALVGNACAQPPVPPAPTEETPMSVATLQSVSDAALADAASRTGLPVAQLKVTSAEAVTWRDGSLGCPEPGMVYTEALVPGYRVRITADGREFDYHATSRGSLLLCPAGRAHEPLPSRDI